MKNTMKIWGVFMALMVCSVGTVANEQYKFRLIDVVDGLSDNQIRSLSVTPDGRIGIRTASILNIYDGASFEHFPYDKDRKYVWDYARPPREYYDSQGRVWMKELRYLLLLDQKTNMFDYDIQEELEAMGVEGKLKNMFLDESKNFWFLTEDNTFRFYDVEKRVGKIIDRGDSEFTRRYGIPLELAQYKNHCWVVYSSGLIRCWDYSSSEFFYQDSRFEGIIGEHSDRLYLHPDTVGNLWLMYNNGIFFYNRTLREWKDVASISGISNFFTCMDVDVNGDVWAGTSGSGLRFIDSKTFQVTRMPNIPLTTGGILENDIFTIMADNNKGLWVGTLFQGLCYYHPSMQKFHLVQTSAGSSYITNESVRCFLEEDDGNILIGCRNGLFRFHPFTLKLERIFEDQIKELVISLSRDRNGNIWVGTFVKGFYEISGGGLCKHFLRSAGQTEQDVAQNVSRALFQDIRGRYWVAVTGGVGRMDSVTGQVVEMLSDRHPELKNFTLVHALFPEGEDGFVGLADNGLFYYDAVNDRVRIPDAEKDKFYKPGIKYFDIMRGAGGLDWFATEDGIRVWDAAHERLYLLTTAEGLPNNAVSALLEDDEGTVWASTLNGICKITFQQDEKDGYTFSIASFGVSDGLQSGTFYTHTALKARNGMLYFGGAHGFNYFDPKRMVYDDYAPVPLLTGLTIFDTPIHVDTEYNGHRILTESLNRTREIELRYNENFITLDFSGLNYANPSHTYYKYRLRNFDERWVESGATDFGRAVYTGLRPGKYVFEVYAANGSKIWSREPARLTIVVRPPFWASVYAYVVYILALGGLMYCLFRSYIRREKARMIEERREHARKQQEHLDEMKLRFFTNISHEFRTPLTLILTPLGTLIRHQEEGELRQKLMMIHRNAEKMLKLVNQLLDFRKLEMSGERLTLTMNDIVQFVADVGESFKDLTKEKGIELAVEKHKEHLYMYCDYDKVQKIVNNLLSNAVKFTPSGGKITLEADRVVRDGRGYAAVSVSDTGCGMSEKDVECIFTRFYQVENGIKEGNGSGIGLHLVKGYVDLHGGEIMVESRPGEGSRFTVLLPVDLKGKEDGTAQLGAVVAKPDETSADDKEERTDYRKKILVVEDNAEFRAFLAGELRQDFDVIEAEDGVQGEELALAEFPDLIVSDLMMPRRNGIEFCRNIKDNIQTSHISFILLTAKMSEDARVESYQAGADSYIAKPFNFELLLVRINKLIEQREKRKETFMNSVEITPSSITTTSLDEEFVKKAVECVERNMDKSEYSLDDLSKDLGLSKTHLNRKLTAIVNMKPLAFIRSIRLKRAAQLLVDSQYNVNEIADMVGFNTLKYFNRYFKEEFGMPPTQYRNMNRNV